MGYCLARPVGQRQNSCLVLSLMPGLPLFLFGHAAYDRRGAILGDQSGKKPWAGVPSLVPRCGPGPAFSPAGLAVKIFVIPLFDPAATPGWSVPPWCLWCCRPRVQPTVGFPAEPSAPGIARVADQGEAFLGLEKEKADHNKAMEKASTDLG
jgi:hypothetical protein